MNDMRLRFFSPQIVVAVLLSTSPVLGNPITDGLVGYWPLNETSGNTAHDASGHGNDGTLVNYAGNSGSWVPGQVGGALHFDAKKGQYITVPSFIQPTTSFSLSAWVNADSLPMWASIAANWNAVVGRFHFENFSNSGLICDYYAQPGGQVLEVNHVTEQGAPLSLNTWHLMTLVSDGSSVKIYRDGQQTGSTTFVGDLIPAPVPQLTIGGHDYPNDPYAPSTLGFWDGEIQDVALWTRALSVSEVASLYQTGLTGNPLLRTPDAGGSAFLLAAALVGLFAFSGSLRKFSGASW
ncbi:MAG: LamG domain-containing protein [Verrucomicrobiota bacterium]